MAFVVPTFNLTANYWDYSTWGPAGPYIFGTLPPPPDSTFACQLRFPSRVSQSGGFVGSDAYTEVLCAKGSPIAGPQYGSSEYQYWCDVIEVPAGTGRYYFVVYCDSVARGFSNEHISLQCAATYQYDGGYFAFEAHWPWAPPWPRPMA